MAMEISGHSESSPALEVFDRFPGGEGKRAEFILNVGRNSGPLRRIADIGGGANPLLAPWQIEQNGIEYSLLDISEEELQLAPASYNKILVDLTAPLGEFCRLVGREHFDLVFSHDFLEHVRDPVRVHRNIHAALRPGGLAIHFYPAPRCLPLLVNRMLPETLTHSMLRVAQPHRDLKGRQGKFPAFYAMCGPPSRKLQTRYMKLGFEIIRHTGYIGHDYYARLPVLRDIERSLRPMLCRASIPLISRAILVLRKLPGHTSQESTAS